MENMVSPFEFTYGGVKTNFPGTDSANWYLWWRMNKIMRKEEY